MLRRSFISSSTPARSAIERECASSNILARTSARIAGWLSRRRKIDDLADYVDKELRLEFSQPAFDVSMAAFTFTLMVPLMYVVCEGRAPPSRIVTLFGAMKQEDYDKLFQYIPWQMCSIGHAFLFAVVYAFATPYVRYPFFIHGLAPFFRKMNWVRPREFASAGENVASGAAAAAAVPKKTAPKRSSGWKTKT